MPEREPLLGRERELLQLRAAYEATRSEQPVVMFVAGASGMGKSAMIACFLGELRAEGDAAVLAGRCYARENHVYLEAAQRAAENDALELKRRAAEQLLISGHIDDGKALLAEVLRAVGLSLPGGPRRALLSLAWQRLRLKLRGLGFQERKDALPAAQLAALIDDAWNRADLYTAISLTRLTAIPRLVRGDAAGLQRHIEQARSHWRRPRDFSSLDVDLLLAEAAHAFYGLVGSQILHARLAFDEGQREQAIDYLRAALSVKGLTFRAAARRRLGQLLGGDEGAALVAEADAALRGMGAVDLEATTRVLTSGTEFI